MSAGDHAASTSANTSLWDYILLVNVAVHIKNVRYSLIMELGVSGNVMTFAG